VEHVTFDSPVDADTTLTKSARAWISVSLRSCLRGVAAGAAASPQRTTLVIVAEKRSLAASTAGEPCNCGHAAPAERAFSSNTTCHAAQK